MTSSSRSQVLLLATAQALFQTASVMVMTIGGLAGAQVTSNPSLVTAPIAAMFLGTAVCTVPASSWMSKVGRRKGFVFGASLGILAGALAAMGLWLGSLAILCAGTFFVGAYQAFAQFYRFAAGEVAEDSYKARAISLVLAGGIVAAVLGPALGRVGGPWLDPAYVGSFLLLSLTSLVATGLLLGLRVPAVRERSEGVPRSLSVIVRQPSYLVALFAAATGYGVMILAMTATPIAMIHHHHSLGDAATVIQLHVLAMFAPSFFTGALITRFGVLPIMTSGVALLTGHVLMTLTGTAFLSFASALMLLGIGWNFLYVGGTTLLTTTYTPSERGRAQAANDLSVFIVGLLSSLSAGALLQVLGWQALNLALLPWLACAAVAIGFLGLRRRASVARSIA